MSPGLYELSEGSVDPPCVSLDTRGQNDIKTIILLTAVFKELAFFASALCI